MMIPDNFRPTEIVELPAIINKGGVVNVLTLDMMRLEEAQLEAMAKVMDGEVVFIKMRAAYLTLPENERLCMKRNCWRPVGKNKDWCEDHPSDQPT